MLPFNLIPPVTCPNPLTASSRFVLASTNCSFKRAPVLDTNVVRILERFFGLRGRGEKSRDDSLWQAAEAIAPKTNVREWNWALIQGKRI
jgi:adenine-specific DNA glycosylase